MDKIEVPISNENLDSHVVNYKRNIMHNKKLVFFIAGLFIGIVFFAYTHIYLTEYGDTLGVQRIVGVREIDIHKNGVIQYIFCVRIKQLLMLILCASSFITPIIMYLIAGYLGFGFGIVLLSALYKYGIKGIFLGAMMFFPHGIFYLLIFLIIFYKIDKDGARYYKKDTCKECIRSNNRTIFKRIAFNVGDMVLIVMLQCLGILSEAYISTWIVEKISIFFVN